MFSCQHICVETADSPSIASHSPAPATQFSPSAPLLCPLCDYNLTGLERPQCPECGHIFEWDELTDPSRRKHKWFFEHRRFMGGFLRTHFALFRPWRFWKTVRPAFALRHGRIVLFSVVSFILLATIFFSVPVAKVAIDADRGNRSYLSYLKAPVTKAEIQRSSLPPSLLDTLPPNPTHLDLLLIQVSPSMRSITLLELPVFPEIAFFKQVMSVVFSQNYYRQNPFLLLYCFAALPLPIGIFLLGIMSQSFSKARIKRVHLLRVAVYSSSPLIYIVPLLGICFLGRDIRFPLANFFFRDAGPLLSAQVVLSLPWLTHLHMGVKHYLGIPRAWSVTTAAAILLYLLSTAFILYVFSF